MLTHAQAQVLVGGDRRPPANVTAPTKGGPLPPPSLPPRPVRRAGRRTPPTLEEVDVDPSLFMSRCNPAPEALGKFRRVAMCGHKFFYTNDYWAWYIPTMITVFIVVGNILVAWPIIGWPSFVIVLMLVTTGFVSSYLVTCTDPGIYPRLQAGEVDPLAQYEGLVYCRVCNLRRPPRTSHCYQCNVCVLEHDHHCGVLGGCVGIRSLRWFTLFLVCQTTACCIGMYWLSLFLVHSVSNSGVSKDNSPNDRTTQTTPPTTIPNGRRRPRRVHDSGMVDESEALRYVGVVFMMLFDMVVIGLVGAMAVIYVYLTVSSTTRRESQKRETSFRICLQPRTMLNNIWTTAFPPGSLLGGSAASGTVEVVVEEVEEETDGLV